MDAIDVLNIALERGIVELRCKADKVLSIFEGCSHFSRTTDLYEIVSKLEESNEIKVYDKLKLYALCGG